MNKTISITYDKSPKDLTALTSFEFSKDENVLKMKVGYIGNNADEIIKIVTEQGYIDKHDSDIIENVIKVCAKEMSKLTGLCQRACPIHCEWGEAVSCEKSWEEYFMKKVKDKQR